MALIFNPLVSTLAVLAFFRLASRIAGDLRSAILVTGTFAFGTFVWAYAGTFMSEPLATLLVILSLDPLLREGERTRGQALGAGLFLGLACAAHITAILFVPFFAVLVGRRVLWAFATGLALPLGLLGMHNWMRFGDLLETGRTVDPVLAERFQYGHFAAPWRGLVGLLIGGSKGLVLLCPAVALGIAGLPHLARRRPALAWAIGGAVVFRLVFIAARSDWHGGVSPGPRLLVMAIPLLLIPAVPLLDRWIAGREWAKLWAGMLLAFVSTGIQATYAAGDSFHWTIARIVEARASGVDLHLANRIHLDFFPPAGLVFGKVAPFLLREIDGLDAATVAVMLLLLATSMLAVAAIGAHRRLAGDVTSHQVARAPAAPPPDEGSAARGTAGAEAAGARAEGMRRFAAATFLFLATLAVYAPALGNGFVDWDDPRYVERSPIATQGLAGIVAAWTTSVDDAWYPLTHSVHALVHAVAGPSPAAHHAVQWVLAALAVALVPAALRAFGVGTGVATAAALAWMAHPMRVESFAWVANLKDTLSLLLVLLAFAAWGIGGRRASAFSFTAALLAKTTVFPLAGLFVLLEARSPEPRALLRALRATAAFWVPAILVAAIAARLHVFSDAPNLRTLPGGSLLAAIPSVLWLPWWYLGRTVSFADPQVIYGFEPVGWMDGRLVAALVLWGLAIAACVRLPTVAPWQRAAALLGFVLPFLPVTGLVPLFQHAADRYALLPSLAFTVVLCAAARALFRAAARRAPPLRRASLPAAAAALGLVLAAALPVARARLGAWRDSVSLWEADRRARPDDPLVLRHLAGAYGSAERWDDAIAVMKRVLELGVPWNAFGRDWFLAHAARDGMDAELAFAIALELEARQSDRNALLDAARRASTAGHPAVGAALRSLYAAGI